MGKRAKKVEKMIKNFKRTQTQTKNKYNLNNKKGNNQIVEDKKKDIMYGRLMDQISKVDTELSDIGSKIKEEKQWLSKISSNDEDPIQQEVKEKHKKLLKRLEEEKETKVEEKEKLRKQLRENKTKKEMRDEIDKINNEISVINLRIKKYQEKLAKTSPSEKELVAEYLKSIQELEEQKNSKQMLTRKEEKEKLEGQLKQREKLEKEEIEKQLKDQEEEIRSKLSKEKREIEEDIRNVELQRDKVGVNIKSLMLQIKNFEYKYEEYNYEVTEKDENGNKIKKQRTSRRIANTEEYEKLNADYQKSLDSFMSLKETLEDLQEAREICEKEMDKFRQKDRKKMEKFSKALNDAKRDEEKRKEGNKKEEGKHDKKEEQDRKEEEQEKEKKEKPTDEEHTENDSEEIETKWHPELTQEQIEDLKAEGIEPGDQEYDAYLRNHGIRQDRQLGNHEPGENQPGDNQPGDNQPGDNQPGENQPGENQPGENQPGDNQPGDNQPGENQPGDNQPGENQPGENQPGENQPGDNQPGNQSSLNLPDNCKIRIGRSGTITYNGNTYNVSKKDIREAIKISSYRDRDLKRYIKKELGMSKKTTKYLMGLVKDGYLDMTVVHAIYSTDLDDAQKKDILDRQVMKIDKFNLGEKYKGNEIDIEYDMDDLSKNGGLWDRIRGKEVNGKQKLQLCKIARMAERWGLGKVTGDYKLPEKAKTMRERFLSFMDRKQIKKLPVYDKTDLHSIASEYHQLAYDKDGNKLTKRQVKRKYNKFKDDLKVDNMKQELEELIDAHTNPKKVKRAEKKQGKEVDDDGSR